MSDIEIWDLSNSKTDGKEWKTIENYVQESVRQHVKESYFNDYNNVPPPQKQPLTTDKGMIEIMGLIREGLERYRTEPPESNIRKYIDFLLHTHGKSKLSAFDAQYKNRHNALVLEYIISKPMSQLQIMKRLGMGIDYSAYRSQIDKGILELAQIMTRPHIRTPPANVAFKKSVGF